MRSTASILTSLLLQSAKAVALQLDGMGRILDISNPDLLKQWIPEGEREPTAGDLLAVGLQSLFTEAQLAPLQGLAAPGADQPDTGQILPAKPSRASSGRWFELTRVPLPRAPDNASLLLVVDRTTQLNLEKGLAEARVAHELALVVLNSNPEMLRRFLQGAANAVGFIRTTLKQPSRTQEALGAKLKLLRSEAEKLSDAGAELTVHPVKQPARELMSALDVLLGLERVSGDDMLPLALHIDSMSVAITTLAALDEQRSSPGSEGPRLPQREAPEWRTVCEQRAGEMLSRIGAECGVLVRLRMKGTAKVPERYHAKIDAAIECLVDNAIRHGIETPEDRISAAKPAAGTISVSFNDRGTDGLEMTVQDDGRGFDLDRIRTTAIANGAASTDSGNELEPSDLVALIFKPASGRSMALLRESLRRQGGNVSVATKPGRYTRFTVRFAAKDLRRRSRAQTGTALTR